MAAVYAPFGFDYRSGGWFDANNIGVDSASFTVRVELSDSNEWVEALEQFGRENLFNINTSATVRVCIGASINDFGISPLGLLQRPVSWAGDGATFATRTYTGQFTVPNPFPGYSSVQNNLNPNLWGSPSSLVALNGLPDRWTKGWELVAGSYSPTTSNRMVVYAYEIDPPSGEFTNPPGWIPTWAYYDPNNNGLGYIAGDGTNPIDKTQTSMFKQRINVSQNTSSIVAKGVFRRGDAESEGGSKPALNTIGIPNLDLIGRNTTQIVITLSPQMWLDDKPIINTKKTSNNQNNADKTGGDNKQTTETQKPFRDGPGNRPTNPGFFPGGGNNGGFTPVYPSDNPYIALDVNPDPINHNNTDIGTVKNKSFTITNIGTASVQVDTVETSPANNPFSFAMASPVVFPFTIGVGQVFSGISYFIPTVAQIYSQAGTIKSGNSIIRTFSVTGTSTTSGNPGDIATRKIALFGDTATSGDTNFLEQILNNTTTTNILAVNAGTVPITLSGVSLGGSSAFTTTGITAGVILPVGGERPISVSFTPITNQEYIGTFTLLSNAQASDQAGFDPATGSLTCTLRGRGILDTVLTRIMSFNIQNNGTFPDVLAGGSATADIAATITNIGNATLKIEQFQVESPFTLDIQSLKPFTTGLSGFYYLTEPYLLGPGETSPSFKIIFSPPTVTNYVDDVAIFSNKTIGPASFEVRGFGVLEVEEPEPPEPPGPPDDEPPPGEEFDPGTSPSSALDGDGSSCIPKECGVIYVYEYSSNGQIVT